MSQFPMTNQWMPQQMQGGGLTGRQAAQQQPMSPYWGGGPFGIPSVNGSTYSQMPAYEMPNWFNNAPWDVTQWQNMTPEQLQATVAFNQQAMPWTQMAQAYQQWQNEFNQNAYQWGNEFDWKKLSDQFAMDMATRQQDTSESQWGSEFGLNTRKQDFTERQWGDEFGLKTRQQDASERQWGSEFGLQTRKQDFTESQWGDEFGLKTQDQANLEKWRDTQATLEREKMATDAENQALAAWGRRMRPNTRWM